MPIEAVYLVQPLVTESAVSPKPIGVPAQNISGINRNVIIKKL